MVSLVVWVYTLENSSDCCSTSVVGCLDIVGKARRIQELFENNK
jgi:hypothetical protein